MSHKNRILTLIASSFIAIAVIFGLIPKLIAWNIWSKHEQVIDNIVSKRNTYLKGFDEATDFLSHVSGIQARLNMTFIGIMPTDHTKEDLKLWREWYRLNRHRLHWNYFTKEVEVKDWPYI